MRESRRGFTLLELLVTIAIIGILIALLLPAVQKVRDSAARAQCANNLRQIAIALHNYHDTYSVFPPGVTSSTKGETYPRMSWLTRLLPYIEQDVLWRTTVAAYEYQSVAYLDPPHVGFGTPMRLFSCPADGRMLQQQSTYNDRRPALTSYVGVLGTVYSQTDGVLFEDSSICMTDISDGTSNTLMAGERPPSPDFWYGWWYAGYGQSGTGSADMLLGVREVNIGENDLVKDCARGPYHFVAGTLTNECDVFHYWSLHSGGGHFLFADGAVRFLGYGADSVLPALATRAGNELVALPY